MIHVTFAPEDMKKPKTRRRIILRLGNNQWHLSQKEAKNLGWKLIDRTTIWRKS